MVSRGAALILTGAATLVCGAVVVYEYSFEIGLGISILGVFALGVGVALMVEPWNDGVDEEVDRWERNWTSTWTPECPVHGFNLCVVRTRSCPQTRHRMDA